MNELLHPLPTDIQPPRQFTYPFCYEPHPLCRLAAAKVQRHIADTGICRGESGGKMFGVLVVRAPGGQAADDGGRGRMAFLAAYSGLLSGRNDWSYFVPPVFDAQRPDGHFKQTERLISDMNHEIESMLHDPMYMRAEYTRQSFIAKRQREIDAFRQKAAECKARREARRQSGVPVDDAEREAMARESQYMKAELRRMRKDMERRVEEYDRLFMSIYTDRLDHLRRERRRMSDDLQTWLFRQYGMLNALGERRDLVDIFADTAHGVPPAGSGDCCAPKLLQYAYANGLQPLCMAEFWWGDSPKREIRHHLHYYPACRSKCLPILTHMLRGLDVEPNPLAAPVEATLRIVYEDGALAVVDKPAGMLSVPGKEVAASVDSVMRGRWHIPDGQPMMVHRLDRDTSGLMVVARTTEAYHALQRQFADRQVSKRYDAVLDGVPQCPAHGIVDLPLRPDPTDRPRQCVDPEHGKRAVTRYAVARTDGHRTLVHLWPMTGRTHQLRMHCAHGLGLGTPILGDPLYGHPSGERRMYLHAAGIEFAHPMDGRPMAFASDSHFADVLN